MKIILGDFNHCSLDSALPHYHQYVSCPTRGDRTLDLCYCNIPDAYKCVPLAPLRDSDHNNVQLIPKYKPLLKRAKPAVKVVKKWTSDATLQLQECFEKTDWDVFINNCTDINELTDTISSYILFCEENIIKGETIKVYPNNKPWVTRELKEAIINKNNKFKENNIEVFKKINWKTKSKIKECKRKYKERMESYFESGNSKQTWEGMKKMTGYQSVKTSVNVENESEYVNDLNEFYVRFDCYDFKEEQISEEMTELRISEDEVQKSLLNINVNKSCGPDYINDLHRQCRVISDVRLSDAAPAGHKPGVPRRRLPWQAWDALKTSPKFGGGFQTKLRLVHRENNAVPTLCRICRHP
ncbi:hypothetical protein ElyMa_001473900 [Elysia marginata]|uniref:Myb-like domain-containing protein n=1 Tax=Elysia marginata TaxID=1093978 RepID=A0AAV4J3J8_9GAST|nr:hypothetical protein ElyMa_001473900 [Elysia marginata]